MGLEFAKKGRLEDQQTVIFFQFGFGTKFYIPKTAHYSENVIPTVKHVEELLFKKLEPGD